MQGPVDLFVGKPDWDRQPPRVPRARRQCRPTV